MFNPWGSTTSDLVDNRRSSSDEDKYDSLDDILDEVEIEAGNITGEKEGMNNNDNNNMPSLIPSTSTNNSDSSGQEEGMDTNDYTDMPSLASGSSTSDSDSSDSDSDSSDDNQSNNSNNENNNNNNENTENIPVGQLQDEVSRFIRSTIVSPNNVNGNAYSVPSVYANDMESIQDLLLNTSILSNQMSNRMVTEARHYRQNEGGRLVSDVQEANSARFVHALRRYSRVINNLANNIEQHVSNSRAARESNNDGLPFVFGGDGSGSGGTPMDTINDVFRNIRNVLAARNNNNNNNNNDNNNTNGTSDNERRQERTDDERRANINLNTSSFDETMHLVHMAISQKSDLPIFDLLESVVEFDFPKNDSSSMNGLLENVFSNHVGNQTIFALVFKIISEVCKHISMKHLMKIVTSVSNGTGGDLLRSISEALCWIDKDAGGVKFSDEFAHAAKYYDDILSYSQLNRYFGHLNITDDDSRTTKFTWEFFIDSLYTLASPDLGIKLHRDLEPYSIDFFQVFDKKIKDLLKDFVMLFHPGSEKEDTPFNILSSRIARFIVKIQKEVSAGCILLQQKHGVKIPLERICRLVLEQFFRSMPLCQDFTKFISESMASQLAKSIGLTFFAPAFNAYRKKDISEKFPSSSNLKSEK
jgi:hypothetical protein